MRDDDDRRLLLERIGRTVERTQWSCLAYCILGTHLHLLVTTPAPNLGVGMQWLLSSYAREFNEKHHREGNLFHTRFYSTAIRSDAHLRTAIAYVHLNPVRAGVVMHPEEWPWSSYAATIGDVDVPSFLDAAATLELFDPDREKARLRLRLAVHEARAHDRPGGRGV